MARAKARADGLIERTKTYDGKRVQNERDNARAGVAVGREIQGRRVCREDGKQRPERVVLRVQVLVRPGWRNIQPGDNYGFAARDEKGTQGAANGGTAGNGQGTPGGVRAVCLALHVHRLPTG